MKVRIFIIITVLILLYGAAYWYFELERPKSKIEHILPETSLFAIHGTNLKQSLQAIEDYEWFSIAKSIPFVKTVVDWSDKVDSLETSGKLKSSVTQLPFWISFHSTGSSDITPLYIIESSDFKWNSQNIVTILNTLTGTDYTTSNQLFNGFNLLNVKGGNTQLVMLIQGSYLVISEENLLVEDVVRALENESNRLVDSQYKPFVDGDLQLIVNTKRMNELHQVFFSEDLDRSESVGSVAYLNLSFGAESISAQGTSAGGEVIAKEDASLFGKNLIPITSTAFKWMPFNVGMTDLKELLRGEMLAVSLDMNFSDVAEVLLINTADTVYLRRELDRLSESKTSVQDSTVYSESYLNTTLGYIQQSDFVELLTSGERKMDEPYYAIFQNALILSDNLDALKTIMNEFDNESTWGKSVERRRVLDDLVQETDLTIIKDLDYGSESIFDGLKPVWKEFFSKNPGLKTLLKRVQIQLNSNNESYLVSSTLDFNKGKLIAPIETTNGEDIAAELVVKANAFADTTLVTKPFIVRNHVNSSFEVVFQDQTGAVYLTTRQGEILWKTDVGQRIRGGIHQIDYYNNKKLQYLFFTDSLVHLIDRNGEMVDGFPKSFESPMIINGSAVVDYDNSKRYRYLAKDRRGNISLFDKEVNLLEGWNPKAMESELLQTPFHTRVRGRDAFVVVERTGEVSLLNRRGEFYSGFPKTFDLRFKGDVTLVKGPNFAGTNIALMGEEGMLLQINLEGKVVQEKQLFRPTTRSMYSMVSDVLETGFRIIRNDQNRIAFYDMSGEQEFEIDFDNSGELNVEFYNFRNGKELYAVRDIQRNQLYLFNNKGEQICPVIPASERISILYYQNLSEYEVFVNFANQLNIYAIDAQ
ncbi:hypothetical protein [uncultured Roseivirga sp.]|uniref:hypothetical protein n=1 Tax=uncultured Roseivirga sp. TaxID=543088 RepID=UPI000D7A9F9A|nr:hypothetical protein [uncultured Roseivirga sp.]PWL24413.1 MAG: hypothetical protein DCO95_18970 [Roseivirga sp. XM-24bin3]